MPAMCSSICFMRPEKVFMKSLFEVFVPGFDGPVRCEGPLPALLRRLFWLRASFDGFPPLPRERPRPPASAGSALGLCGTSPGRLLSGIAPPSRCPKPRRLCRRAVVQPLFEVRGALLGCGLFLNKCNPSKFDLK